MNYKISVIIPLYNKQSEIATTIASVLGQSYQPHEVVVVNDGSSDNSADVVRRFNSPLIRLITQSNGGVCRARNRAMSEATGDYFALLDADDIWHSDFLKEIARLIETYPGCGLYCTNFNIISSNGIFTSRSLFAEGIVENYFRAAVANHFLIPSIATIDRRAIDQVGGFPDGMRLGEDQYMWLKIFGAGFKLCYSPQTLCDYNTMASNRSMAIYRPEQSEQTMSDQLRDGDIWRNEYVAKTDLNKAIAICSMGGVEYGRRAESLYGWTKYSRRALLKLKILNRLPAAWRQSAFIIYSRLAWVIAKRGL